MSSEVVAAWLIVMMAISVPAIACVFFVGLAHKVGTLDRWYIAAILLCTFGLIVQCVRSVHYLKFGGYPIDNYVPLWITKDLGIVILIFRFVQRSLSGQFGTDKPKTAKRRKAAKAAP